MTVTQEQPTKIGQRVQEIYTDSRGWVTDLGVHCGVPSAVVDWDDKPVGDEDKVFPVDALRVVKVVQMDLDHYQDPSLHPKVESSNVIDGVTTYNIKGGLTLKGIEMMRVWLIGYHTSK